MCKLNLKRFFLKKKKELSLDSVLWNGPLYIREPPFKATIKMESNSFIIKAFYKNHFCHV